MQPLPNNPTAPGGPMTEAERAYALDALASTRHSLHATVAGLSAAQLAFRPAQNRWTIAECVEHVALVETGILAGIRKGMHYPADPARRADVRHDDLYVVKAVRSRATQLPAPEPFVPTGRFGSVGEALAAFNQQRDAASHYVRHVTDDLRTHYFRHPALGWLDCYQAVLLLAGHVERHRKQIDEIKASEGFPA